MRGTPSQAICKTSRNASLRMCLTFASYNSNYFFCK
jgi:hypothetical protein